MEAGGARHIVHVRINDAATGQPTAVRLRLTGPTGEYLNPFGRLADFATDPGKDVGGNLLLQGRRYTYIDGACEVRLPAGNVLVEASKGPEYRSLVRPLVIRAGQLTLRLAVERWADLRQQGWYSGDGRAHYLAPHAALLEAAAEDLAVANLLAFEDPGPDISEPAAPRSIPNILAFSGQRPALEMPGHQVIVNTHNVHPVLGSLGLLNCHRPVYPLTSGGNRGTEDWCLADWCDQCHRKGGLVVRTRLPGSRAPGPFPCGEALAELILGKIDALEAADLALDDGSTLGEWYSLLNAGLRVPLLGASAKVSNREPLGGIRTYARLLPDEALSYATWIEAVRRGRSYATEGPLLAFTVDGADPGTILTVNSQRPLAIQAAAQSLVAFDRLEVVANGEVVAAQAPVNEPFSAAVEFERLLPRGGWITARCVGAPGARAHSSPVYVRADGMPIPADPRLVTQLAGHLEQVRRWVQQQGRFEHEARRLQLEAIFRSAGESLLARMAGRS